MLVSACDTSGREWCAMDRALAHQNIVDQYDRRDSRLDSPLHSRLVEAISEITHERHQSMHHYKSITVGDAVELSSSYKSPFYPF